MNRAIRQAINKHAHALTRAQYQATRLQLLADADRLLAQGLSQEQVIATLCARGAPARVKQWQILSVVRPDL